MARRSRSRSRKSVSRRSKSRSRSATRRSKSRSRSTRKSPARSSVISGLTKYYLPGQTFRRGVCVARQTETDCNSDLQCAWDAPNNKCYKKFNLGAQPAGPALPVGYML
jgi:hypothetical protein